MTMVFFVFTSFLPNLLLLAFWRQNSLDTAIVVYLIFACNPRAKFLLDLLML